MIVQYIGAPKWVNSDFVNDEGILKNKIDNISDDEGDSSQNKGSNNGTLSNSSTTSIPYRRNIGPARRAVSPQNEGDLNEDVLAAKPSPDHKLPYAKPNSKFKLDELDNSKGSSNEEEAQHEFVENQTHTSLQMPSPPPAPPLPPAFFRNAGQKEGGTWTQKNVFAKIAKCFTMVEFLLIMNI